VLCDAAALGRMIYAGITGTKHHQDCLFLDQPGQVCPGDKKQVDLAVLCILDSHHSCHPITTAAAGGHCQATFMLVCCIHTSI
jgi:hypothetical protein